MGEGSKGSTDADEPPPAMPPPAAWVARRWQRAAALPTFRLAVQAAVGTVVIMAICSPTVVFDALSFSETTNISIILVIYYMSLLVGRAVGLSPWRMAVEPMVGGLVGGGLGLAVTYIVLAINGGHYEDTWVKAVSMLLLSAPILFVITVFRFLFPIRKGVFLFCTILYSIPSAGGYHMEHKLYKLTLCWWYYIAIGGTVNCLVTAFVLPVTAGGVVRHRLAAALKSTADVAQRALDIMTGEVAPDTGLLAAASGVTSDIVGVDSGLLPQMEILHNSCQAAEQSVQASLKYLYFAEKQPQMYRRQRWLPIHAYKLVTYMSRALLNALMMLVYPLQSGHMHVGLVARHRGTLLDLAVALVNCSKVLGDVFVYNAPVSAAVEALEVLEARYAAFAAAAAAAAHLKGSSWSQDVVALDMVLNVMFSACTRVRHIVALLPEALGADQPLSEEAVVRHFQQSEEGSAWTFPNLYRPVTVGADPLSKAPLDAQTMHTAELRKEPAAVLEYVRKPQTSGWMQRWMGRLTAATGIRGRHLAMASQLTVSFTIIFILIIIPQIDAAFNGHMSWAIFTAVVIIDLPAGGAISRSLQRMAGVLLAAALGIFCQGATYLLNGLSYDSRAWKDVVMTTLLAVLAAVMSAASVKFLKFYYVFAVSISYMSLCALPSYEEDSVNLKVALWRTVATLLGVVMTMLSSCLVFPISARHVFKGAMGTTLESIAGVATQVFASQTATPVFAKLTGVDGGVQVMGPTYAGTLGKGTFANVNIASLLQLEIAFEFEFYPFSPVHRFPVVPGYRSQRLCRHLLNVLATTATALDIHEARELPLLTQQTERLHRTADQLAACLRVLAAVVRGEERPRRAAEHVLALEEHAVGLFLAVITQADAGVADADVITSHAFLALVFNVVSVARLLSFFLVQTFWAGDAGALSEVDVLAQSSNNWALDDSTLQKLVVMLGRAGSGGGGGVGGGAASAASGRFRLVSEGRGDAAGDTPGGEFSPVL